VTSPAHDSITAGLNDWDHERTYRMDSGESQIPGRTTVRQWLSEATGASNDQWRSRGIAEVHRRQPDHPVASRVPIGEGTRSRFVTLFVTLSMLGHVAARQTEESVTELFAHIWGIWLLESRHRQRIFSGPFLAGRVIPGPSPSPEVPAPARPAYPRTTGPIGPDP
jgi:hypothetical protein